MNKRHDRWLRRVSPSLVLSVVAVFFGLGGAAFAVDSLVVKTKDIADGAVTTRKIRNHAVDESKLADGAVTSAKIAPKSVRASDVAKDRALPTGVASVTAAGGFFGKAGAVVDVIRPSNGTYCFDLAHPVWGGVATLNAANALQDDTITGTTDTDPEKCVQEFTDFQVNIRKVGGGNANDDFYIVFF